LTSVLTMLLRLHLNQSIQRTRQSFGGVLHEQSMGSLAVGFVDLVGFTSRSTTMTATELSDLVSKFEALASDTVTSHGGRLVKLIGDELMFVAVTPQEGCVIGDALLQVFGTDPALTPRGGMAYGPVLARSGDYFGSTVNLAARLVDQAVPGEILVTANIAEATTDASDGNHPILVLTGRDRVSIGTKSSPPLPNPDTVSKTPTRWTYVS
jgi:adenylate cyclase